MLDGLCIRDERYGVMKGWEFWNGQAICEGVDAWDIGMEGWPT